MRSKFKQYIYEFRGREIGDNDIFSIFTKKLLTSKGQEYKQNQNTLGY